MKETEKILEIGEVNGFTRSAVLPIIKKHMEKKRLGEVSTFFRDRDDTKPKRAAVRYYPDTRFLRPVYDKVNMELMYRNEGTLSNLLGSTKDEICELHKSGIYRIQCGHCGRCYFGMTVHKLFVRFNEHIKSTNWKQKTAVGNHIFSTAHGIDIGQLKLIRPVKQLWKVEYYEAIHIHRHKHENLLNMNDGDIQSPLLRLFLVKRKYDERPIDLIDDQPSSSGEESFYDCE